MPPCQDCHFKANIVISYHAMVYEVLQLRNYLDTILTTSMEIPKVELQN